MNLVIVESPTKAKTISQFLSKSYRVESSGGHIRDLPKSKLGIDIQNNFQPVYLILAKARQQIALLKKLAEKSGIVILATDEDREGEAIAWHLIQALGLNKQSEQSLPAGRQANYLPNVPNKNKRETNSGHSDARLPPACRSGRDGQEFADSGRVQRIVFHEITEPAILEALKNPRGIDQKLVDSQQARRVLDRLVGYELSPFLWRKVRYGLSAGRVQSVAVRLVVEREREIENFKKEEYWSIEGDFSKTKNETVFRAKLYRLNDQVLEKFAIKNEKEAQTIVADLKDAAYHVKEVVSKTVSRFPAPAFTTSTLQQEASRRFGFSAKQTMLIAQHLYENGFITYIRTDSVHLAESALGQAKEVIIREFGKEYILSEPRRFATKTKGAQEAHEAVRPTDFSKKAESLSLKDRKHQKLYELIWKRGLASQMKEAIFEQTTADIEAKDGKYIFRAAGQVIKFDGFLRVYNESRNNGENNQELEGVLPALKEDEKLKLHKLFPLQHFTEPPARYTDATLVKTLEAAGVGRPSTYAPILSTIQERGYVEKPDKKYRPTEIGIIVNDILVKHFPEIVDINFTSHIEEELDEIAAGNLRWTTVAREFYEPFKKHLLEKESEVEKYTEVSETPCPHCGKPMNIKFGRLGKFLACPDPDSKITLPLPEEAAQLKELQEKNKEEKCPNCGKPMEVKKGRYGFFLGCVDYPKCKGVKKIQNKTGFRCPACLADPERQKNPGEIVERKNHKRHQIFYGCTRYPECRFVLNKKPETEKKLEEIWQEFIRKNVKPGRKTKPAKK